MQKQKHSESEKESKYEENHLMVGGGSLSTSDKRSSTSWKGLASRYKRLLRSKPQDVEFRKGLLTYLGCMFVPLILISPLSMIGGVLYATLGAFIGNFIANAKYDLDILTNIHFGILGSLPIIGYFTYVSTLSGNGSVSMFLMLMYLTVSMVPGITLYGQLGETLNEAPKK